ncbi:hypothetical protein [Flagellimonas nanhaiensis]|uniref:DUF4595 domain-containing protein n=1 Tax=Flagellimonas nanhaiensis TaxID=2292706 RepID=A0A371JQW9_9FLAO|nr:hypothetical protein [Allomuricauda nanhaiensis]RDY59899.1 hypothetical protein DX873_11145 [Allomuricauda nanhaiensis]
MKILKFLFLCAALTIIVQCSKNNDGGNSTVPEMERGFFPKTISLQHDTGETIEYELSYDLNNNISFIDQQRNSNGDVSHMQSEFHYSPEGQLMQVLTEDVLNGIGYDIFFTYGGNNIITGIDMEINATAHETTVFYNEDQLIYGVNGDLGNLPTSCRFDAENNLTEMYIGINHIQLETSENSRGIFADMALQPALSLWNGLFFFYTPYELYFFNQNDLEAVQIGDYNYQYQNKIRDGEGNLLSFDFRSTGLSGTNIKYAISYEKRSL